jgi:hypothetical protein
MKDPLDKLKYILPILCYILIFLAGYMLGFGQSIKGNYEQINGEFSNSKHSN